MNAGKPSKSTVQEYSGTITGSVGHWFLLKVNRVMGQLAFLFICLKLLLKRRQTGARLMRRVTVQQIYFTGVQSLELIVLLALLIGPLVVILSITQVSEVGNIDDVSKIILTILVRELGPLLVAVIVILRSGSAIAMEIGYMNVLGEIEGLEMMGIPSMHYLCIPRLFGVLISMFCLIVLFNLLAIYGGFLAYSYAYGINYWTFLYSLASNTSRYEFYIMILKGFFFGMIIPVICLYHGFQAQGAITNVPSRVSRALVDCLIYCIVFDIMVTVVFLYS